MGDLLGMGERSDRKIIDAKTACIPCFYDYKEGGRLGVYGLGVGAPALRYYYSIV